MTKKIKKNSKPMEPAASESENKQTLPAPGTIASDAQFTAFANTIYDQVGLGRLIDQLSLVERSLFRDREGAISTKARDYLGSALIEVFEELEKTGLEPQDDQKQAEFLKDLTRHLLSLPVVKVTVAFEPTHGYVMKLNNQISAAVGKKVILDIVVDENVIGGAIFEYRGKLSEQTLKNKLHDELVGLVERAYTGNK